MTRLCRRALGRLLGVTLVFVLAAAPAYARRSDEKAIWCPPTLAAVSQFPVFKDLGVGIVEMHLYWFEVARTRPSHARDPQDPAYRWPLAIDEAIQQAAKYHMRIMLQVLGTPTWANGNRSFAWAPAHTSQLASFFTAAAKKYKSIHLWMVWGEATRARSSSP